MLLFTELVVPSFMDIRKKRKLLKEMVKKLRQRSTRKSLKVA